MAHFGSDSHLGLTRREDWRRKFWALRLLAKYGMPDAALSFGGGFGDQLLLTTLARELFRRKRSRLWVLSSSVELFLHNPDIRRVLPVITERDQWFMSRFAIRQISPSYAPHIAAERRDIAPDKHLLAVMCEQAGIRGQVALRPYLRLSRSESTQRRPVERQIVIQNTGRSARHFMSTKEWYPERFQEVVAKLGAEYHFVQVGASQDPKLEGAEDLRGKTTIRETAALLQGSMLFVGLVGFVMHLARAVDCRAVIVYGGRELPAQSGYSCNINLTGRTACSPCWRYDDCAEQRSCMNQITVDHVVKAIQLAAEKFKDPIETENYWL